MDMRIYRWTSVLAAFWVIGPFSAFANEVASNGGPSTSAEFDPRIPVYQQLAPVWALEIAGSPNLFGGKSLAGGQTSGTARSFSIEVEYQPTFVQRYGVLSLGPSVAIDPVIPLQSITKNAFSVWQLGLNIRYQARFFREQPVVPVVGYALNYVKYSFLTGANASTTAHGPMAGVWLLLNSLDQSGAADFYVNMGVLRSYVVAELRSLSENDPNIAFSGQSYFFGLRFEI